MKQQQLGAYQLDLFTRTIQDTSCPSHHRKDVIGAEDRKELQVKGAGEQKRALAENYDRLNNLRKPPCARACTVV